MLRLLFHVLDEFLLMYKIKRVSNEWSEMNELDITALLSLLKYPRRCDVIRNVREHSVRH